MRSITWISSSHSSWSVAKRPRSRRSSEPRVAALLSRERGCFYTVLPPQRSTHYTRFASRPIVKNLLSIAAGLTQLTGRSASTVVQMTGDLTERLTALGRAHDVVRPLPGEQGKAALLGDLLSVLLAPYDETAAFSGRIRVAVPRMGIGERAASTLALVVHELATNSVKYGALSRAEGSLDVSSRADGDYICLTWAETGGPSIVGKPELSGFGSRLIKRTVSSQLGGELTYDWQESGLVVTVRMQQDRLVE